MQGSVQFPLTSPPAYPGTALTAGLNTAFQTLITLQQGAAPPTAIELGLTTLVGIFWHDLTTGNLNVRNQADTAWITLGQFNEASGVFTANGTLLPSVAALRAANLTGTSQVTVAGYYGVGTPGGGVFVQEPSAGADNGGTIIHDAAGNVFVRINTSGSFAEWGATGNTIYITTPAIGTQGQNTFTTTFAIPLSAIGNPIAIAGGAAGGATLTGHIISLAYGGGVTTVTLDVTLGSSFPLYVANNLNQIVNVGTNGLYAFGDTCVMSDGTTVIVNAVDGSGNVVSVTPSVQASPQTPLPGTLSQSSTSGSGRGMTCTLKYTGSGQFAYGTDDTAAINAALAAAKTTGINPSLPQNFVCGITAQIVVPAGVYIEGPDMWSSGFIMLATGSETSCLVRSGGKGGGGSAFFVDAMKLRAAAVELVGTFIEFDHVQARNGVTQDYYGSGLTGGCLLNFCDARQITSMFGLASQLPQYNYNLVNPSSIRLDGCTSDGAAQAYVFAQGAGLYASNCDVFGGSCYAYDAVYGFDVRGSQAIVLGNQVGSVRTAAYRIAGANITCTANVSQWGLASYAGASTTAITIEASGSPYFAKRNVVTGNVTDNSITNPANIVLQNGTADPNTIVQNNAGASYTYPPAASSSAGVVYAQAATNAFAKAAATAGGAPLGQYYFNAYDAWLVTIGATRLAQMDGLYFLATVDEATALINIANPAANLPLLKNGTLSFTQFRGYRSDGTTGYLNTQLAGNVLPNFRLNNGSMYVWTGSPSISADNSFSIGTTLGGRASVNPRQANGNMGTRAQDNTGTDVFASSVDSVGGFGWSRPGSASPTTGYTQLIDGLPVAHPATTATTINVGTVTLLMDGSNFSNRPIAAALIGASFADSDWAIIDAATKQLLTIFGAPT